MKSRCMLIKKLPEIIESAQNAEFVLGIYFEKYFEEDLEAFRKRLNIKVVDLYA